MKRILFVLLSLSIFAGCSSAKINILTSEKILPKPADCPLEVLTQLYDKDTSLPLAEVITGEHATFDKAEIEIRKIACSLGGDGISSFEKHRFGYAARIIGTVFKNKKP